MDVFSALKAGIFVSKFDLNILDPLGNTALLRAISYLQIHSSVEPQIITSCAPLQNHARRTSAFSPKHQETTLRSIAHIIENCSEDQVNCANFQGNTPLLAAAFIGHVSVCKSLLKAGADVQCATDNGYTVAMAAARIGSLDIMEELFCQFQFSSDDIQEMLPCFLSRVDTAGRSALWWAVDGAANSRKCKWVTGHRQYLQLVSQLCSNGADVEWRDEDSLETLLMHAAVLGDVELCEVLLENDARVNAKNIDGWTPLMFACFGGSADCSELLLQYGADMNQRDSRLNMSALELAEVGGKSFM